MKTVDPTYKEWMADNLDIDENEVNRLDHYDKDSLAMYRDLYPQAAVTWDLLSRKSVPDTPDLDTVMADWASQSRKDQE